MLVFWRLKRWGWDVLWQTKTRLLPKPHVSRIHKLKIKWGRTSAPLLFFHTFWVLVSTSFWDDQKRNGGMPFALATGLPWCWNLICTNIFPSTTKKEQIKEMLPAFSSYGLGENSMLVMIFHACCFPSCPTSGAAACCFNAAFCRDG